MNTCLVMDLSHQSLHIAQGCMSPCIVLTIFHYSQQFVKCSFLYHRHQSAQLHADHRADPPDQFIQLGCVFLWYAVPPAHQNVEEGTGYCRLVEHPQKLSADVVA